MTEPQCPLRIKPSARSNAIAAKVKANGGSLTAAEIEHFEQFNWVACAWTKRRATTWIARERKAGKWLDAHAHSNGYIYVPRTTPE